MRLISSGQLNDSTCGISCWSKLGAVSGLYPRTCNELALGWCLNGFPTQTSRIFNIFLVPNIGVFNVKLGVKLVSEYPKFGSLRWDSQTLLIVKMIVIIDLSYIRKKSCTFCARHRA